MALEGMIRRVRTGFVQMPCFRLAPSQTVCLWDVRAEAVVADNQSADRRSPPAAERSSRCWAVTAERQSLVRSDPP